MAPNTSTTAPLGRWFIRVVSIGAFALLTTPVAGHVIARASYLADVPLWDGTVLDERRQDAQQAAATEAAEPH